MNLSLPPALFYAIGAMLITFGSMRAFHLGWQALRRLRGEVQEDEGEESPVDGESDGRAGVLDAADERRRLQARRHVRFGLLWVAMGLFLVISTVIQTLRSR